MVRSLSFIFTTLLFLTGCRHKATEPVSKITVDNNKVRVTEYDGDPTGDVCGHGLHKHGPHLTILLTDGEVVETRDGKAKKIKVFKGLSFWSNGETHSVVNIGTSPIKSMIVEVKEPKVDSTGRLILDK